MQFAFMVEPFMEHFSGGKLEPERVTDAQRQDILDQMWDDFYSPYADQMYQVDGLPLIAAAERFTWGPYRDSGGRYSQRNVVWHQKLGPSEDWAWVAVDRPPSGVFEDGTIFVWPRYDEFGVWLSHRPDIRGLGQFQPHKALLSNAMSPSIGSFGVFYENRGVVEVNYSVAEMVTSSSVAAHPRMVINEMLGKYTAWQDEAMMRHDIASFLYAVSAFMVGSLINPAEASDQWLRDYVISKCNDKGITNFFSGDGDNGSTNLQTSDGDGISLLLINSEGNHTE